MLNVKVLPNMERGIIKRAIKNRGHPFLPPFPYFALLYIVKRLGCIACQQNPILRLTLLLTQPHLLWYGQHKLRNVLESPDGNFSRGPKIGPHSCAGQLTHSSPQLRSGSGLHINMKINEGNFRVQHRAVVVPSQSPESFRSSREQRTDMQSISHQAFRCSLRS